MSDTSVNGPEKGVTQTHIGGQAVLEGVMMRGHYNWAVAVRTPDGEIHSEEHALGSSGAKREWMRKPIIRGVVALVESLTLAMKAFTVSASLAGETEEEQLSSKEITFSLVFGVGLAVLLFIVAPAFLTNVIVRASAAQKPFLWNIVDGVLRVLAFFAYIWAISRVADIKRVFAYHGAEHKVIHAYEHGLPLETPLIQKYSTQHVRCGTSFLLMVMVVAIIVFSLVPVKAIAAGWGLEGPAVLLLAITTRLLLMPVVAGLAYEITVKWAGSRPENPLVKVLLWPGLQLQRMTTAPPDDGMIEVAVASMQLVIACEEREAARQAAEQVGAEAATDSAPDDAIAPELT